MRTLLRWVIKNQLGRAYRREIEKLVQYAQGDTPAVGILGIFQHQEMGLVPRQIAPQDALATLIQTFGDVLQPAEVESAAALLADPARTDQAAEFLQKLMPAMKPARARKIVEAWAKGETAEFPEPVRRVNVPRVMALRLGVDIFVPTNTPELKRARVIFHREMISRAELEGRGLTHGYSDKFIKGVLGQEGVAGFEGRTCLPDGIHAVTDASIVVGSLPTVEYGDDFRGLYEVITAFWRATNDDGVLGVYTTTFSAFVDTPATKRELLGYIHGEYPYVEFPCEILSDRLADSRGVPERVCTQQYTLKNNTDQKNDSVQLRTVPPIRVPASRPNVPLPMGPLVQLRERRPNEYGFLEPPEFPAAAMKMAEETRRQVDEYWGRWNDDVPRELVALHQQDMVDRFLASLADALGQMLQLVQQYMTDEEIARVVGGRGLPVARSVSEIQGKFDISLDFDVRTLSPEYVLKLAEAVSQWILPADTRQTVQRDRYVALILGAINPMLAEATVRPGEEADQAEADDEDANFAKIAAGIEPAMMEAGQNFALRLARLESIPEANPAAIQKMTPDSVAILEARLNHLRFQVQQEKNKIIGRVGAKTALGEPGE